MHLFYQSYFLQNNLIIINTLFYIKYRKLISIQNSPNAVRARVFNVVYVQTVHGFKHESRYDCIGIYNYRKKEKNLCILVLIVR